MHLISAYTDYKIDFHECKSCIEVAQEEFIFSFWKKGKFRCIKQLKE